jgi:hypothetical protein
VKIPFSQPVQGEASENLLLEFMIRETPGKPEPKFWVFDEEAYPSPGMMIPFGTSCSTTAPFMEASAWSESLRPGSSTLFTLAPAPKNALTLHFLGSSDSILFGQPILPLSLGASGAPGCTLYTDPFLVTAHLTDAPLPPLNGEARLHFHMPLSAELHGLPFYSQWIVMEPGTNALGLSTSNGVKLQLSSGPPTTGVAIVWNWDLGAPTGIVHTHFVPVMKLVK